MSLKDILDPYLENVHGNLYCHRKSNDSNLFERVYLTLRRKEGRFYPDGIVKGLPKISQKDHPHLKEWAIRRRSLSRLIAYLDNKTKLQRILEVGCGNGWLSNNLSRAFPVEICSIDVNETELIQASRLFDSHRLSFVKANIMEDMFPSNTFDVIILASSIQYFPSLNLLIKKLLDLLTEGGEIHILDSPICSTTAESSKKQTKTNNYFASLDSAEMSNYYFYHTFDEFAACKFTLMYNPNTLVSYLRRRILGDDLTPFPWVKITRN
jgi:SAM-dependent methyltransferase